MPSQAIAVASSGSNALLAAQPGKSLRVLGFALTSASAVTAKFQSAATDLTGPMSLPVVVTPGNKDPFPLFQTVYGEALNLNLGSAVAVNGYLLYDVVQS